MPKVSAGLLMYRRCGGELQYLLVHPGGPFWKKKDAGAWTIPKGEIEAGEEALEGAQREFTEELGFPAAGPFFELSPVRQKGGKVIQAWAFEGDCDPLSIRSNTFKMQWPPGSGVMAEFPEIDRAEFFALAEARIKINPAQISFLEEVVERLQSKR